MKRVVLGPVPCKACRVLVTWNGWEWQDWRGRHVCHVEVAA